MLKTLSTSLRLTLAASGLALATVAALGALDLPMWHPLALITHLVCSTVAIFAIGSAIADGELDTAVFLIVPGFPILAIGLALGVAFAGALGGLAVGLIGVAAAGSVALAALTGPTREDHPVGVPLAH